MLEIESQVDQIQSTCENMKSDISDRDLRKITDYQRRIWMALSYLCLCRYYIIRDEHGNFVIEKAGKCRLFFYYCLWINSVIKIIYLALAYRGYLPVEIHFLDQMGMWDWFLCFSQAIQEVWIWAPRKTYEIMCANWKIQERIYGNLGAPEHIQKGILKMDHSLVIMHSLIITGGSLAIGVQFLASPKYAAYLYSVIPFDDWPTRIIFSFHEMFYIYHIWIHQAWSIILCEQFANSYTLIMREMCVAFQRLMDLGIRHDSLDASGIEKNLSQEKISKSLKSHNLMQARFNQRRKLNPKIKAPGTDYDIISLIRDYEKMCIGTNCWNSWTGRIMGGTMGSNYSQFVSDVFMMIQLLKEPETDTWGVFFYGEDALMGMLILFRMLMIISRLSPASEEFLHCLKQYAMYDTPLKKYLMKYRKGQRIIGTRIGGYRTTRITVPKGINCLMNWYINAALWKRPVDRLT